MNFFAFSSLIHRSTSSCSTPLNSGNSESIAPPPSLISLSVVAPKVGFAEIPENPSDPPHLIQWLALRGEIFFFGFVSFFTYHRLLIILLIKFSPSPQFAGQK